MNQKCLLFLFISILFTNSGLSQNKAHHIDSTDTHCALNAMAVADVDCDGDPDVISGYDKCIYLHENDGNGNFAFRKEITSFSKYLYVTSVHTIDIDSDDDQDILFTSVATKPGWLENKGDGKFKPIKEFSDVSHPLTVDIDHDGDKDILTYNNNGILWLENIDNGNFLNSKTIKKEKHCSYINTVDINGDHYQDIFYYGSGNTITFLINDGNGNFNIQKDIFLSPHIRIWLFSDLNEDGLSDLIIHNYTTDKLSWVKNKGNFQFGNEQIITTSFSRTNGLKACDMNGDKTKDLLWVNNYRIGWYKNDGKGNFNNLTILGKIKRKVEDIHAADMDSDGDMDAIAMMPNDGWRHDKMVWFENELSENNKLNIFPNPTAGKITISTTQEMKMLQFFHMSGQEIRRIEVAEGKQKTVNIKNFARGVYLLRVSTEGENLSAKIIKQ